MRISAAQRAQNENHVRAAMDRLLRGEIPPDGNCDVKTLAREALLTEQSREFPQFSGWMTTESDMVCGHDRRW
jgi:hypothetical protein